MAANCFFMLCACTHVCQHICVCVCVCVIRQIYDAEGQSCTPYFKPPHCPGVTSPCSCLEVANNGKESRSAPCFENKESFFFKFTIRCLPAQREIFLRRFSASFALCSVFVKLISFLPMSKALTS